MYTLLLKEFQHCIGGGEGKETHFETDNSALQNSILKAQKINTITQVSQGILSTIVEALETDLIPVVQKVDNGIHLGRVVRKPVNINPGLNVNWGAMFSC